MTRRISPAEAEAAYERVEPVRYCPSCEGTGTEPRRGKSGKVSETQCGVCAGSGVVDEVRR